VGGENARRHVFGLTERAQLGVEIRAPTEAGR
jgi:hypothetical protein